MCGYLCSCTWACTWLLVQTNSSCAHACTLWAYSGPMLCPCTLRHRLRVCGEGVAEEHGQTPVQSPHFLTGSSRQGEAPSVATMALRPDALRAARCLSRASWQRQDNMLWGAEPLGSPLKCLMRSDTYHLKSPACPRSRTTTGLLLISLRSLCWLLNNKHRRGRCD